MMFLLVMLGALNLSCWSAKADDTTVKDLRHLFPLLKNPRHQIVKHPYPHYVFENFLPEDLFLDLQKEFPYIPPSQRRKYDPRINGKQFVYGEPNLNQLLATSAPFRRLHDYVNSSAIIEWAMRHYGHFLRKGFIAGNCTVDPRKVYYEHRIQNLSEAVSSGWLYDQRKLGNLLPPGHDNNRLYSRMDLSHGYNGHFSAIHLDVNSMIMGFLIFLDDVPDHAGGQFAMFHDWNWVKNIQIKKNMAISHLSGWFGARHAGLTFNDTLNPHAQRRSIHIEIGAQQTICR